MTAPDMFAIGSPKWPGLSKLAEESGEAQQVIGKLMGTGGETAHWDGTDLRERLIEEVGDVLAAALFVADKNYFKDAVMRRSRQKLGLFEKWHAAGDPLPVDGTPQPTVDVGTAAGGPARASGLRMVQYQLERLVEENEKLTARHTGNDTDRDLWRAMAAVVKDAADETDREIASLKQELRGFHDSVDVRIAKLTEERDAERTQKDALIRQIVAVQDRANQFESLLRIMRTRRYAASSSTSFDWRVLSQYWNELDALLPESKPHTCINTQATSDGSVPPPCPACQEQPEHTAPAPALGVLVVHKVFGMSTVVSMPENGDKTWMRLRLIETGDVYLAYTADVSLLAKEKR